jgi:hypothetical protein
MANSKNIIVGAARVFLSVGEGDGRPDLKTSGVFPWNINVADGEQSSSATGSAASVSTPYYFTNTSASSYWRDLGFTTNGVEVSYEPGYGDVMVDQLLDAARLFKQTLKIMIKTEMTEGTLENLSIVFGQGETVLGPLNGKQIDTLTTYNEVGSSVTSGSGVKVTQLNLSAGAIGDYPVEKTLCFVGNAAGTIGRVDAKPTTPTTASAGAGANVNVFSNRKKERVYVGRRIVQVETTAHALKRDAATVFPVNFRCLPDDRADAEGTEYGFIIDRVYG